jgi:hypothetical protein
VVIKARKMVVPESKTTQLGLRKADEKHSETVFVAELDILMLQGGLLDTITKPDGVILLHSYDALLRLVSMKASDGSVDYYTNMILTTTSWLFVMKTPYHPY